MEFYSDCLRRTIATSAAPSAMKATVPAILAKEDDSSVSSACCSCDRDNVSMFRLLLLGSCRVQERYVRY